MTWKNVLLIISLLCFVLAAVGVSAPIGLVAMGLACGVSTVIG